MMDRWPELIPLFILAFAVWSSLRSRRKRRQRQKEQHRQPSDWSMTREGQIDHLNRRRREDEGG